MLSLYNAAALVCFLLLGLAWLVANKKAESKLKNSIEKATDSTFYQSQFKCVVINPGNNCCNKVLEYSAKPILLHNAPELPLKSCTANCVCSFTPREDRRSGIDRRALETASNRAAYANKRMTKDRRRKSIQEFLLPKYRNRFSV